MREVSERLAASRLEAKVDELAAIRSKAEALAAQSAGAIAEFERLQERIHEASRRITEAAGEAALAFAAAEAHGGALRDCAAQLRAACPETPPDDRSIDLGWIERLYSMEEERVVHFELFPPAEAKPDEDDTGEEMDGFLL